MILPLVAVISLAAHGADGSGRERTPARLARVAELYRDTALGFACQETISYSGSKTGRIRFAYLFIRDESGKLRDFRTWKTGTAAAERGREVDPREPIRKGLNDWAGFASVDHETSQLLEVEAYTPADWNRKMRRDADVAAAPTRDNHDDREPYDIERIVTVFGFEKNGMRFPSHVEITKTRSTVVPGPVQDALRETTLRTVIQDYTHFEFFSVRSSEEILRFVNGGAPLAAAPSSGP
jgi:hypothetical protein